jgi:hypothetical protein
MADPLVPCFYTVVQNVSGKQVDCTFLPPHGRILEAGEQISVPGDIWDFLAHRRTKFLGLERALAAGVLVVISSPPQHMLDLVTNLVKVPKLTNGTLGIADPCWGSYSSDIPHNV